MSPRNISNWPETPTREAIRLRRRIICSTLNITFGSLPPRRRRRRSRRAANRGRPATATTWTTMAISTRRPIVSPRPPERQNAYPQPQQGFQPQPNVPSNPPQPYAERPPYEGERQGQNDRAAFANRQDRQGNRFPERGPRQDRPFADRNEGYRDNRHGRDGRPRDFRPYRDSQSQPTRDVSAEGAAQPELPSFITASPRSNAVDPAAGAPLPDAIASPAAPPEAAPAEFESPSGEGGSFPPRGRRRRLRSPYGFGGGNSPESDAPDAAPEITDDLPVSE